MNVLAPLLCVFLPGLPEEGIRCGIEIPTVRRIADESSPVVLAKWVSGEKPIPGQTAGRTTYQVFEVIRDSQNTLEGKTEVVFERYWPGKPSDLFLLYCSPARQEKWNRPLSISKTSLGYIKDVAARDVITTKWLDFFLGYLEHPDPFVAQDAYRELKEFSLKEFQENSAKLPREKLRQWVKSDKMSADDFQGQLDDHRRGLYSLLLGLCGNDEDAAQLANFIKKPAQDHRAGIDGVMCGYLLLQGEDGLKLLEETKLKPSEKAHSTESYTAMRALYFAWQHTDIPKERLKKSMRLLLDHSELAVFAIGYLTQWKDWDIQDKVVALYETREFQDLAYKRAVIQYFLTCSKDSAENADGNPTQDHAMTAKKHLGTLRQKDPEVVKQVERYFEAFN